MKLAVTYENGQVFQHFGRTEKFKIYEIKAGSIIGQEIVDTGGTGHCALAGLLIDLGVETLICGGIGMGARNALSMAGIDLYAGAAGDVDAAVTTFLAGQLPHNDGVNCDHHGHDHACDHNHDHKHDDYCHSHEHNHEHTCENGGTCHA